MHVQIPTADVLPAAMLRRELERRIGPAYELHFVNAQERVQAAERRQCPTSNCRLCWALGNEHDDFQPLTAERPLERGCGEPSVAIFSDDDDAAQSGHGTTLLGCSSVVLAGQYALRNSSCVGMRATACSICLRIASIRWSTSSSSNESTRGSYARGITR